MSTVSIVRIEEHFQELTDPRRREVTYPLINIVVMALCAVLSGADDFVSIAAWAREKKPWLAKFLDMSAGVPSHDRFNAVLAALRPAEFEKCLLSWVTALHEITDGQVIAIDGKTLRRSFDAASGKAAIHMVSAWATANHVSLGQVVTDETSNEITAIPKAAGNPGNQGLFGDDRRHGLPAPDRREKQTPLRRMERRLPTTSS